MAPFNFPYEIVDLTHTIHPTIPSWDGSCGFQNIVKIDYADCTTSPQFRVHHMNMQAGIGTHLDAPAHCIPGGKTIEQLSIQQLSGPCFMIDVSNKAHERYTVSTADIERFEKKYGQITPESFVIIRTGWDQFWTQPEKYRNNHIFPSVSSKAAQLLLERKIIGIGIDTLSPDRPEDNFPVHALLLGSGICIIENIAHSEKLPPIDGYLIALPIKAANATEAPLRLIALIQKKSTKEIR